MIYRCLQFLYQPSYNLKHTSVFWKKFHLSLINNFYKSSLHSKLLHDEKNRNIRRSLLYVPGHEKKKIKKLSQLNVDCGVLDCEDGVAFDK